MEKHQSIIETDQVRVRIMALAAAEILPYHFHSEVTDSFFCLTGNLVVAAQNPEESWHLKPGEHCEIAPPRPHSVSNADSDSQASYLLVQGVGKYDFNQL